MMILICLLFFSIHRLFDGDETVALIAGGAAGLTHMESELPSSKSSDEDIK